MSQYLIEVGMEEIPARFLKSIRNQFQTKVEAFLQEHRINYDQTQAYATPRRIAVLVDGIAEKQTDIEEKAKGPALKIAQAEDGTWTKAAHGFARGQQMTTDDLVVESVKGEDYVFIHKQIAGLPTTEVLKDLGSVLEGLTFPVSMTWNVFHTPFIRPVHWIVSLLDETVVPVTFINVEAGRMSQGHRSLGHEVTITAPSTYLEQLESVYVMADYEARQAKIVDQIQAIADQEGWQVPLDSDLLEEVTALVEWPTAFFGRFDEKYLEVPEIVLITAMRDHQRYFYALDAKTDRLQPVFISVRNGNEDHLDNVIKGNEKVIVARLEDAFFFYDEDQHKSLSDFVNHLDDVREHQKIGSLGDKQKRVLAGLERLTELFYLEGLTQEELATAKRAASIYKFDLLTGMTGEFSELQGRMGEIYAKLFGESDQVARAIGTQYYPDHAGGELPDTVAGALLALMDKLDTLMNYFKAGLIPTGSNDPFALRRQAMGVVEILLEENWDINLAQGLKDLIFHLELDPDQAQITYDKLVEFIKHRVAQYLESREIDHDIIQAVVHSDGLNIVNNITAARQYQTLKEAQPEAYRLLVESLTRIVNLGSKVDVDQTAAHTLAQTESERSLIQASQDLAQQETAQGRFDQVKTMVPVIEAYFEENMVNADDPEIRSNRQATMRSLTSSIIQDLDPRELISKF